MSDGRKPALWVDSHCHLDFPDFEADRADVLRRARLAGVGRIVTISTRVRQFDRVRALIDAEDMVFGSVGTHPHNADEETDIPVAMLIDLARHPKIVAIGEAGLDFHYGYSTPENQEAGFRRHIEAARETGLPVVIHSRDADERMIAVLTEEHANGPFPGILHCFASGRALAERGLELGLHVSFSGVLTFKTAETIREVARIVPTDRLLVETDAPYLAPVPHRGRRNEPAYVVRTAEVLAEVRGVPPAAIRETTTENAFRLFAKMTPPAAAA